MIVNSILKIFSVFALFSIATLNCLGQDKNLPIDTYIAAAIPDSLKENANAVVRYSLQEITLKSVDKVVKRYHSVVTILNEKGDRNAQLLLFYDKKFNSIGSAEMIIYNAQGKQIKKYRKSDMYDHSATDGISIVTDDRVLVLEHTIASYPVTVEVSYERISNSYIDLGEWKYLDDEQSVQRAECIVTAIGSCGFRFKNKNTDVQPFKTSIDGLDRYTWKVNGLKAMKPEEEAVSWQVFPSVEFAANQFRFGGLPGDLSSWKTYGLWIKNLNDDAAHLPEQRVQELKAMTANLKSEKEKVRYLYNYMQQNVRYVSIQLGIGGLKPFPATFVDQKKYGDCKALANYMSALLKAVNIPSYYALVNAGDNEEPADSSFPANPFNHVILCVPLKGDTTWLECTSNTQPFGVLGSFTENRKALLITETGGILKNTPVSNMADNKFISEVQLTLSADGGAKAKMKILSTGNYRNDLIGLSSLKEDEQKEQLLRILNIKQPVSFNINSPVDKDGTKELDADIEFDKFCEIASGNKMFYRPRVMDVWRTTLQHFEKRKNDFYFPGPVQKSCVTVINLPEGFEVENLPVNQTLKFSYGNYDVNYVYDKAKNQVINTTRFNLSKHVIPAAKYAEMQQYMDDIAKAQNKKLVIRKKA